MNTSTTTRRNFLGTTLAAASPLILPSRVFGRNAPSKRITVGMIGCGRWGSKINLDPFLAMNDVTVVAVCDVDSWRMEFTRRKINNHYAKSSISGSYKGCKAYGDFRELLADPGIDADPVPKSLNYDLWLGPCPEVPYIQRRVHDPEKFERPHWMRVLGHCEGMITNWGTHLNDIAQLAMGTNESGPVWVKAARWDLPPKENLWNVLVDFDIDYRYADGTELNYKVGGKEVYIRYEGDEGWIKAWCMGKPDPGMPDIEVSAPKILADLDKTAIQLPAWGDKQDFIHGVKSRERTMQDVEYGHRTCSLCQLCHISVRLGGREIKWDPAKEISPEPDVNRLTRRPEWRGHWLDETPRA